MPGQERTGYPDDGLGSPHGDAIAYALRQVPRVLGSTAVAGQLREDPGEAARVLGLSPDLGPTLLNIANSAERRRVDARPSDTGEEEASELTGPELRAILFEPFRHIRWTFLILTSMSILTFAIGMSLLVAAMVKAISEQDLSGATLTLGGLGILDFVLLFYGRPWDDIARGLSNSQQARIIALSYLSGISMLRADAEGAPQLLAEHTRRSVELLEQFTEPPSGGYTRSS